MRDRRRDGVVFARADFSGFRRRSHFAYRTGAIVEGISRALGFFLGSCFAPLTALALQGLPPERKLRAAEEVASLRIAAGAFGIALQGVALFRRTPLHQLQLADRFGGRQFSALDWPASLAARYEAAGLEAGAAQAKLFVALKQKSAILAFNDAFLLASDVFVGLAGLVWLARSTRPPTSSGPAEDLAERRSEELMEES